MNWISTMDKTPPFGVPILLLVEDEGVRRREMGYCLRSIVDDVPTYYKAEGSACYLELFEVVDKVLAWADMPSIE